MPYSNNINLLGSEGRGEEEKGTNRWEGEEGEEGKGTDQGEGRGGEGEKEKGTDQGRMLTFSNITFSAAVCPLLGTSEGLDEATSFLHDNGKCVRTVP